ncbi:collagen alpha-1(I) chain-like [Canis lupus familiaris]|uniref:collagen alpha-1(I) chain-like n=1 Tax=Canis lupus familiaris TaxID=9615 RepID=UPI000BA9FB87|nr:collagen alpha-1(I) chain-like [Canis lupus familiaris]XP_038407486.1 collagen alpha-1(I) chain-like [Canis lupus familiaris]XP_038534802.1 collagen alpha-1(I) chain-like [Canis lupus familiaris]|eukprot:XP_022279999.1 collectin-12-like [Canis lupus familiaris]
MAAGTADRAAKQWSGSCGPEGPCHRVGASGGRRTAVQRSGAQPTNEKGPRGPERPEPGGGTSGEVGQAGVGASGGAARTGVARRRGDPVPAALAARVRANTCRRRLGFQPGRDVAPRCRVSACGPPRGRVRSLPRRDSVGLPADPPEPPRLGRHLRAVWARTARSPRLPGVRGLLGARCPGSPRRMGLVMCVRLSESRPKAGHVRAE